MSMIFPPDKVYERKSSSYDVKDFLSSFSDISSIEHIDEENYVAPYNQSFPLPTTYVHQETQFDPEPSSYLVVVEMNRQFFMIVREMYYKMYSISPSTKEFYDMKTEVESSCLQIVDAVRILIERGDLSSLYCSKMIKIRSETQKICKIFNQCLIEIVEDYFSKKRK